MPLPTIADTFRVTLNWQAGALQAHNVLHFRSFTHDAAGVLTAIDANVTGNMWAPTALGASVTSIEATKLDGSSATATLTTTGTKWTGQTTGEFIPAAAMVVTLRTNTRGRRNRGRVYVPFVAEANNSNGVLVSSNLALAQAAWTTFRLNMDTAGAHLVVASYASPGEHATSVTSVTAQPIMAIQRRRQSQMR